MGVRPGYKRTEVGEIPEEWEINTLGEICTFENGDRGRNYPTPGSFVQSGIPFVNAGHLAEGKINVSGMNYITSENYNRLGSGKVRAGDILFCLRGSLGKFGIVRDGFGKGAIASSLVIVRPKATTISREYLGHYFSSALCAQMIDIWSGGAAQPNLGAKDLARFSIPLPPTITEQRAIAEVLSDVDALIAALDRLIAKNRAIKQGAMQQLLTGQTRLPGFSKPWEVKTLGEIGGKFLNGGTPSTQKTEYWDGNIPWITGADVIGQRVSDIRRFITEDAVRNSSTNVVEQGNLLIVTRTGVGKLAIAPFDLAISQDLTGVYLKSDQALPEYVFRYLDYNSDKLASLNQGTSIAGITREILMSMMVSLPPLPEQRAIAAVLSDMDAEIAALEVRREKTRALKQGMMQELLTGRTRLV